MLGTQEQRQRGRHRGDSAAEIQQVQSVVAVQRTTEEEDPQRGLGRLDSLWELLLRCAVLWYAGFALWTVLV